MKGGGGGVNGIREGCGGGDCVVVMRVMVVVAIAVAKVMVWGS